MLDRKDIDTVMVATGDRWHAPASILAAKAGKDVYSEKPCGLTIEKCQQLAATKEETGRIFQAACPTFNTQFILPIRESLASCTLSMPLFINL